MTTKEITTLSEALFSDLATKVSDMGDVTLEDIKECLSNKLCDPTFGDDLNGLKHKLSYYNDKYNEVDGQRRTVLKELNKLKDEQSLEISKKLPNEISEYTKEQLEWLLYHYYDETSMDYGLRSAILGKNKLFSTGINGFDDSEDIRQFQFLASVERFPDFVKFYNITKSALKDFPSLTGEEVSTVVLSLHINVYGWGSYNSYLEINKENDLARFINYSRYSLVKKSEWMSFEDIQNILIKYNDYDEDEE